MVSRTPLPRLRIALPSTAADLPSRASEFGSSLTWAAVIAAVGIAISVYFTVAHRRRDVLAKRLEPTSLLLEDVAVALDQLLGLPVTKGDMSRLHELGSRVKQAEKRFPSIPLGSVVAALEAYEGTALPRDFKTRSTEVEALLELSREQGARIRAAQFAADEAQKAIAVLLKR